MLNNSNNISIHGGNFTAITQNSKTGKDIWDNRIAPGAFHDSRERLEYDPPKCHPETRVAVIQAIIDWIEDGQKTTFIKWLNGAAGAGKSAIAQKIAELCHESGCLAASFFWSRSAAGRNDEERLVASLAYQLCTVIPQLRGPVESAVESDPYIFTRSLPSQMESLIIQPLRKVFEHDQQGQVNDPMVVILDGLDECGTPEAQQYVLRIITDSISKFPIALCFLIASRPEKAIRDSFNDQSLLAITDRLVLDEKYHPDNDIRLFLAESFESVKRTHELRSLLPPVWPSNNNISKLVGKSSGQFIYAATVVKFVKSSRQTPNKQLDIILGVTAAGTATPFAELDALYSTIFSLVLKEDLHKAMEIISLTIFVQDLTARRIETILAYPHGETQRILIDLHSVLHVPALEQKWQNLRILHASLRDFLLDSSRSKDFHVDEGIACKQIARHFLRYMQEHSDGTEDPYGCGITIVFCLGSVMCKASLTAELLCDCFDFNPVKWVSMLTKRNVSFEVALMQYVDMVKLRDWFQAQEPYALEYLGPTRSLNAHLSRSWEVASDLICEHVCRTLHEKHPKSGGNVATAITHPEIAYISDYGEILEWVFRDKFNFFFPSMGSSGMTAIQMYLHDRERAGRYFVDGGMYALLSMHLLRVVLAFSGDEHGKQKKNDHNETSNGMDDDYTPRPDDKGALKFAIQSLAFYLSNADYNPMLAELSRSVLAQKMEEKHPNFRAKIELLHAAINLYLKKEPVTPNEAHPNEPLAVAEHPRAGKRIRRAITALNKVMRRR
ncbi:hypothetical protein GALMADRAFT_243821 [Galerina marginata CBS 339.88]|uniref:Nephrocystin 3-like N-terminal domain-containing protein n=1 Tax=Galerina marginata (strain CBS 339.88) TaxID=685588 RepID=A0A067T5S8_GALM3|nr:hypothetical protein GALMADRAFT_243821 [Galerina marginata CBS 339.88]